MTSFSCLLGGRRHAHPVTCVIWVLDFVVFPWCV